jgi:hypothetical protein
MKKTITKISFLAIMLCIVMFATNCKKDNTTTTPTPTPTPTVESRDKFIGNFHMTDSVWIGGMFNSVNTLDIIISKYATDTSKINIFNLHHTGNNVKANVSGNNFIIPSQNFTLSQQGGESIDGSGKLENNKLYYNNNIHISSSSSITIAVKGEGTKF